jgi:TetR/AcrR family transcriptional repressor of nem operon
MGLLPESGSLLRKGIAMNEKSNRERLIDVGVKLMHRHGYSATGVSEILDKADLPKGSFYHHFANKEDFAAATIERYATREREHAAAVLNDPKVPPLKRLERYFSDLQTTYGQNGVVPGCLLGRFSLDLAAENGQLRKRVAASFDHWQSTIATVLNQAIAQRELPSNTNAEHLAGFLLNSWQGALVRSQAERSDHALETFMHVAFDFLLKPQ